ncbi:MAG: hypothetical protein JXA71_12995 [Chitinispirillaceae bacterium]|nr:hypothetical protein [Chitinispirillaceae bacterium]
MISGKHLNVIRMAQRTSVIGFFSAALAVGGVNLKTDDQDLRFSIGGEAWVESGQFVKFFNADVELDHAWINRTFMHLTLTAYFRERLRVVMGTEGRMWFNVPKQRGTGQATYVHQQNSTFIISDANASYSFGDTKTPLLSVTAGLFPYKYNENARNLGEYLFRSGTYPAYLVNNFDLAFARLTGFKFSSDVSGLFHQDLIYSIETNIPPFFDGSVSYVGRFDLWGWGDIGAGVSFAHLVSVDERITTQTNIEFNRFWYPGDTTTHYYTFRGTKLMGTFSFDFKKVIDFAKFIPQGIFGKEDLTVYGEALVLGLERYPRNDSADFMGNVIPGKNRWGYDTLENKVPVILGFNWPTHPLASYTLLPGIAAYFINKQEIKNKYTIATGGIGIAAGVGIWFIERVFEKSFRLSMLNTEVEWYGCTYPNRYQNRLGPGNTPGYPVPDHPKRDIDYTADNWKWSVYLKKMVVDERVGLVVQCARDHIRNESLVHESFDYEEALSKNDQWWWMAKIVATF